MNFAYINRLTPALNVNIKEPLDHLRSLNLVLALEEAYYCIHHFSIFQFQQDFFILFYLFVLITTGQEEVQKLRYNPLNSWIGFSNIVKPKFLTRETDIYLTTHK